MNPRPEQDRIRELDALRGLAAGVVLLYHYSVRYGEIYGYERAPLFTVPYGHLGVQLFFIISGYVIFMTLDRVKTVREFAIARFARLYPVFWAACLLSFTVVSLAGLPGREAELKHLPANLTMVPVLLKTRMVDFVYWTLQEELLFYVVVGVVFALGARRPALAVVGGLTLWSFLGEFQPRPVAVPVEWARWFGLFLIGMVIYDSRRGPRWWHAALVLLALADAFGRPVWSPSYTLSYPRLTYAAVIACFGGAVLLATRFPLRWLAHPIPVFLGTISYSWYLTHQNIGYVVIRSSVEVLGTTGAIALAAALSILLAAGLTYGIERPANRRVRKWLLAATDPSGLRTKFTSFTQREDRKPPSAPPAH